MMTLAEAYAALLAAWPGESFSLDLTLWHYDHRPHDPPEVHYRVWNGARGKIYDAQSLEAVLAMALPEPTTDLAMVEQQRAGLTLLDGGRP
jgi:hypothetical protein